MYLKLSPFDSLPISHIFTEVEDIRLSEAASSGDQRTIALTGKVIANPVVSPFGLLVGKPAMLSGGFNKAGRNTRFEFFGGVIGGSHATFVAEAYGSLEIRTPWAFF